VKACALRSISQPVGRRVFSSYHGTNVCSAAVLCECEGQERGRWGVVWPSGMARSDTRKYTRNRNRKTLSCRDPRKKKKRDEYREGRCIWRGKVKPMSRCSAQQQQQQPTVAGSQQKQGTQTRASLDLHLIFAPLPLPIRPVTCSRRAAQSSAEQPQRRTQKKRMHVQPRCGKYVCIPSLG
jgi:hypothetical protein